MKMTVKELIKALEKMPQNVPVKYFDGDNGWCEIYEVEHLTSYYDAPWSRNPKKTPCNFVDLNGV